MCRYGALLQGCLAAGKPVLLVGGSGVGKSAVVKVRHITSCTNYPDDTALMTCVVFELVILLLACVAQPAVFP